MACPAGVRRRHRPGAAREGGGRGHADLLPEYRAYAHLEAIPAAGHAQSGAFGDATREQRFFAQRGMDLLQVGIQIKHPTHAAHDVGDQARIHRAPNCRRSSGRFESAVTRSRVGRSGVPSTRW